MSSAHRRKSTGPLSPQYINGVYIPSAVLLLGVGIFNWHYLPAVAAVTVALGAWQVYINRQWCATFEITVIANAPVEVKKVLNPDVYQEFPLAEKTEISHNVAMSECQFSYWIDPD